MSKKTGAHQERYHFIRAAVSNVRLMNFIDVHQRKRIMYPSISFHKIAIHEKMCMAQIFIRTWIIIIMNIKNLFSYYILPESIQIVNQYYIGINNNNKSVFHDCLHTPCTILFWWTVDGLSCVSAKTSRVKNCTTTICLQNWAIKIEVKCCIDIIHCCAFLNESSLQVESGRQNSL